MSNTHDVSGKRGRLVMECRSGRFIDPTQITPEDVDLNDIAYHLSSICRFGGACRCNVADHSVRVARLVEYLGGCAACQYEGLLHDGHEAYLNDVIAPVGRQEFMHAYGVLKVSVQRVIDSALPGPSHHPDCARDPAWVKTADTVAGLLEADALLPSRGRDWSCGTARLYELVEKYRDCFGELRDPNGPPGAKESERTFLRVYGILTRGGNP